MVGGGNLPLAAAGALTVAVFGAGAFVTTLLVARSKQRWVISDFKPEVSLCAPRWPSAGGSEPEGLWRRLQRRPGAGG